MPYRLDPKDHTKVQVRHKGIWQIVKGGAHKTVQEARKHLSALRINVEAKHVERKDRHQ